MLLWLVTSTQVQSFSMNCFICSAAVVTSSKAVKKNGFYVTMLVAMTPILRVVLRFIVSRSAFKIMYTVSVLYNALFLVVLNMKLILRFTAIRYAFSFFFFSCVRILHDSVMPHEETCSLLSL